MTEEKWLKCPECGGKVERTVPVIISLPVEIKKVTKSVIRRADVEIGLVYWHKQMFHCTLCFWSDFYKED